jgi:uncharacterized Zn finger protein
MIMDKHGGIDCQECGHQEVVTTKDELEKLRKWLIWDTDSPNCPECGNIVTFEDYIDD